MDEEDGIDDIDIDFDDGDGDAFIHQEPELAMESEEASPAAVVPEEHTSPEKAVLNTLADEEEEENFGLKGLCFQICVVSFSSTSPSFLIAKIFSI